MGDYLKIKAVRSFAGESPPNIIQMVTEDESVKEPKLWSLCMEDMIRHAFAGRRSWIVMFCSELLYDLDVSLEDVIDFRKPEAVEVIHD